MIEDNVMKSSRMLFLIATIVCLIPITGQTETTDPYEIINKYYEAMGGLDKFKTQSTSHIEGSLVIEGTGLEGTFVEWGQAPILKRQNIDLGIMKQMSGDNGEFPWTVDHNGKLQIVRDEKRLKDRRVDSLMAEFDHLDRNSPIFAVTYEGTDVVQESVCYTVRIANNINENIITQCFDTTSFYLMRQVTKQPEGEQHSMFSDYRPVGDILMSFKQETLMLPTGMKQVAEITLAEFDISVDPTLFDPPGEDVEDFSFINGRSAEDIPFQYLENHIYLPVEVGGKVRLWVLDTGASMTCIEEEFAKELGLTIEGNIKGTGAGNLVDVSFTDIPAFSLPGLEFKEQKAAVLKLNWLTQQWIGMDVAGILGFDFLSRLVIKVDYANEKLSFYHPDEFQYRGLGTILEAPLSESNAFHLPIIIDGQYEGKWNLDLGAGGMSFHYPYAEKHGFLERPGVDRVGFGAGGSQMKRSVQFKTVEFAGFTWENPVMSMPSVKGEVGFGTGELDGNIGNTLLEHFVLYLDYKREQVIVEKGDDYDRVFPRDNSGVQVIKSEEGNLEVLFVAEGTPGARAGFQKGDIITSVNDIDVSYIGGIIAMAKLLREEPGTKYTFGIMRDGTAKTLKLTLQDLYQ
jgi:hypothetical protein